MTFSNHWTPIVVFILGLLLADKSLADAQVQESIAQIAKQIDAVAKQLNNSKMQLKTERNELYKAETTINRLESSIDAIEREIKEATQKSSQTAAQIEVINANTLTIKEQLRSLLLEQYKEGNEAYIKQLLNQQNPYALGRLNHYRERFSEAMLAKLEEYKDLVGGLNEQRDIYKAQIIELEAAKQKEQQTKRRLDDTKKLRQKNISNLDAKLGTQSTQLKKLTEDRDRLQALLKQIQQKAAELAKLSGPQTRPLLPGGFAKQRGRLSPPVRGSIVTAFGQRIAASGLLSNGLFYRAAANANVTSIYDGRVIFSDYLKGFGLLIIIDHGDDHISLYGHNSKLLKAVGDSVLANEAVAKVGATGGQKEPGLYFEIRQNTRPVNPSTWIAN